MASRGIVSKDTRAAPRSSFGLGPSPGEAWHVPSRLGAPPRSSASPGAVRKPSTAQTKRRALSGALEVIVANRFLQRGYFAKVSRGFSMSSLDVQVSTTPRRSRGRAVADLVQMFPDDESAATRLGQSQARDKTRLVDRARRPRSGRISLRPTRLGNIVLSS